MKIVIDIDKESYEHIKANKNEDVLPMGWYAISHGTPLTSDAPDINVGSKESGDCISRAAVLDQLNQAYSLIDAEHKIKKLKSVTPQPKRRLRLFKIIDNNTGKEPTYDVITDLAKLGDLMSDDIDGFYVNEDGQIILVDDCGNCTWLDTNRFDIEGGEEI